MQYLTTYNPKAQHYGEWFSGFDWSIYGCGTFRKPLSEKGAVAFSKRFFDRLSRQLHSPVAYVGVVERRYSGCGLSPIPHHLHFLAANIIDSRQMTVIAQDLWSRQFGNAKIDRYDPSLPGVFYVTKLAAHDNGALILGNLDRLTYHGSNDLIGAANANQYVPDHLKDKLYGEFLVLRDPAATFVDVPEGDEQPFNEPVKAA